MEVPPWAREAVATFNYVHHALFAALHAALPQLVAVVVSCFIMASLIVAPCFLPLMLWASTRWNMWTSEAGSAIHGKETA